MRIRNEIVQRLLEENFLEIKEDDLMVKGAFFEVIPQKRRKLRKSF